jgi:hypothetical protein
VIVVEIPRVPVVGLVIDTLVELDVVSSGKGLQHSVPFNASNSARFSIMDGHRGRFRTKIPNMSLRAKLL